VCRDDVAKGLHMSDDDVIRRNLPPLDADGARHWHDTADIRHITASANCAAAASAEDIAAVRAEIVQLADAVAKVVDQIPG
jgi:hypothetical protein